MMEYDISNRIGKALPARDMNRGEKKKKRKKEAMGGVELYATQGAK